MQKLSRNKSLSSETEIVLVNAKLSESHINETWLKLKISHVRKLDLSFNYFSKLYKELGNKVVCLFDGFANLEELNISSNPIEHIHPLNFNSTPKLKVLIIENSNISKDLNFRFLRNLPSLEVLSFKGHKAHSLSHLHFSKLVSKEAFVHLKRLDIRSAAVLAYSINKKDKDIISKSYPCLELFNGKAVSLGLENSPIGFKKEGNSPKAIKFMAEFPIRNSEAKTYAKNAFNDSKENLENGLGKTKGTGCTSSFGDFMIRSSSLKNFEASEFSAKETSFVKEASLKESEEEENSDLVFELNDKKSPWKFKPAETKCENKDQIFTFKKPESKALFDDMGKLLLKNFFMFKGDN